MLWLAESERTNATQTTFIGMQYMDRLLNGEQNSPGDPAREAKADTLRILVVDDNEDTADTLAEIFETLGHEARVAYDGPSGLALAGECHPHVVFLDLGLPGMHGHEVAKRLRAHPSLRDCYLVALSGYGQPEDRQRSREVGFDRHLVKPVDLDQLQQVISDIASSQAP